MLEDTHGRHWSYCDKLLESVSEKYEHEHKYDIWRKSIKSTIFDETLDLGLSENEFRPRVVPPDLTPSLFHLRRCPQSRRRIS